MAENEKKELNKIATWLSDIDRKSTNIENRLDNVEKRLERIAEYLWESRKRPMWSWYFAFGGAGMASGLGLHLGSYIVIGDALFILGAIVVVMSMFLRLRLR